MAEIVEAHVTETDLCADPEPEVVQPVIPAGPVSFRGRKYPVARSIDCIENLPNRLREPDRSRTRLAIAQEEMAFAVVGPSQRQDLPLAAARQQKKADDGGLVWPTIGMRGQRCGQSEEFFVGQETLAPLPAVPSDAPAGVRALGSKTHRLGLPHDDGKHRHGPVGRDRRGAQGGEPVPDLLPVDVGDRAAGEARQDLVAQIAAVHVKGPCLPDPFVMLEHGVGDGVEERLLGMARRVLAPPDRGKHRDREGACLPEFHGPGVADDLPDAFAAMLAMDEEAFPARGQHPDAETPELAVADVVGGLAGPERPNAGVGEYKPTVTVRVPGDCSFPAIF